MNGIQTGECGAGGGFCNIYAWCPVEKIGVSTVEIPDTSVDAGARTHTIDNPINNDDSNSNVNTVNRKVHGNDNAKSTSANTQQHQHRYISDVEKWTVFIKVDGDFALFNHSTSNAMHGLENGVNLFSIGDIARGINTTYEEIAEFGAIVQMTFVYDCDLDGGWGLFGGTSASTSNSNRNSNEKDGSTPEMGTGNTHAHQGRFKREDTNIDAQRVKCQPRISYRRLDAADNQFSRGFNYRYVTKDNDVDGTGSVRTLNKAYGLRLLVGGEC